MELVRTISSSNPTVVTALCPVRRTVPGTEEFAATSTTGTCEKDPDPYPLEKDTGVEMTRLATGLTTTYPNLTTHPRGCPDTP